jgi:hypothetical protein
MVSVPGTRALKLPWWLIEIAPVRTSEFALSMTACLRGRWLIVIGPPRLKKRRIKGRFVYLTTRQNSQDRLRVHLKAAEIAIYDERRSWD